MTNLAPAAALLAWYRRHRRTMPWRANPGERPDPYHVWLSEIMLQQTTVAAVKPYFARFLTRFPDLRTLADATQADVLPFWAGLGYYARGRNLHACAQSLATRQFTFPADVASLERLPGIGPYTARAIAAIAFGVPVVPVDGNVERVTARLFAIETPLPAARPILAREAARLGDQPAARAAPSDFAQALFDLGATICTPRKPACALCPWRPACAGQRAGIAETLPRKTPKTASPHRYGAHFFLRDAAGRILLRRRPPTGLFAGMMELPGTPWRPEPWTEAEALAHAPMPTAWRHAGTVHHTLTHRELSLDVYAATVPAILADAGELHPAGELAQAALPTVMRHCIDAASGHAARAKEEDQGAALDPPRA